MKCELCHNADAETAIVRGEGDAAEELYVCHACATAERQRRQKKSQRTRKVTGLPPGVSMSITEIRRVSDETGEESGEDENGENPPPFLGAIMNAFQDMVSDLEKAAKETKDEKGPDYHDFPSSSVSSDVRRISVMDIDTPGGSPVTLRVRWLFFWRRCRSALAQAWQTYSSSAASPSPRTIAVSASALWHSSHFMKRVLYHGCSCQG